MASQTAGFNRSMGDNATIYQPGFDASGQPVTEALDTTPDTTDALDENGNIVKNRRLATTERITLFYRDLISRHPKIRSMLTAPSVLYLYSFLGQRTPAALRFLSFIGQNSHPKVDADHAREGILNEIVFKLTSKDPRTQEDPLSIEEALKRFNSSYAVLYVQKGGDIPIVPKAENMELTAKLQAEEEAFQEDSAEKISAGYETLMDIQTENRDTSNDPADYQEQQQQQAAYEQQQQAAYEQQQQQQQAVYEQQQQQATYDQQQAQTQLQQPDVPAQLSGGETMDVAPAVTRREVQETIQRDPVTSLNDAPGTSAAMAGIETAKAEIQELKDSIQRIGEMVFTQGGQGEGIIQKMEEALQFMQIKLQTEIDKNIEDARKMELAWAESKSKHDLANANIQAEFAKKMFDVEDKKAEREENILKIKLDAATKETEAKARWQELVDIRKSEAEKNETRYQELKGQHERDQAKIIADNQHNHDERIAQMERFKAESEIEKTKQAAAHEANMAALTTQITLAEARYNHEAKQSIAAAADAEKERAHRERTETKNLEAREKARDKEARATFQEQLQLAAKAREHELALRAADDQKFLAQQKMQMDLQMKQLEKMGEKPAVDPLVQKLQEKIEMMQNQIQRETSNRPFSRLPTESLNGPSTREKSKVSINRPSQTSVKRSRRQPA